MESFWRLLVAIFLISIGTMLLLVAYIFQGTAFTIFCVYAFFVLIVVGLGMGIFAIVGHHIDSKNQDNA